VAVLCCLDFGEAYVRRLAEASHFSAPLSGERKITSKLYAREKFKQKSTYFVVYSRLFTTDAFLGQRVTVLFTIIISCALFLIRDG